MKREKDILNSLWNTDIKMPEFSALEGDTSVDVLIIGGGMAGILCAWALKQRGIYCLLVEGSKIGSGITKGTTAVITAQHDQLYVRLAENFGETKARTYLKANLEAVERFKMLASELACDFEIRPSYIFSQTDKSKMEKEAATVRRLGFPAEFVQEIPLPFPIAGAVKFPEQAQFHPLKFIAELAPTLNIRENTFVTKIKDGRTYTNRGTISSGRIIVATHFPFKNSRGFYFMKLYQQRSYVIALEGAAEIDGAYVEDAENGLYFRTYGDLLLVGGGDHRTGKSGGGLEPLRDFAKRYYPAAREKYAWATQDCMSLDSMPYIGPYWSGAEDTFVLTGFSEWGMTSSMVGAAILSDTLTGEKSEYSELFSPQRSILHKQLLSNIAISFGNLILPKTRRCPHMGCALKWNAEEQSWDCECHGSRFDKNGHLIDNPAMKDGRV